MWMLLLLAAARQASMDCGNMAAAQTAAVPGPGGVTALLKVASEDDHSKNSHACMGLYTS